MRRCLFCERWFKNKQAVRAHLRYCGEYLDRPDDDEDRYDDDEDPYDNDGYGYDDEPDDYYD